MKLVKTVSRHIHNHMLRVALSKARRTLLQLPERTLTDSGLSRDLLLKGVSAWPWRVVDEPMEPLNFSRIQAPATAPFTSVGDSVAQSDDDKGKAANAVTGNYQIDRAA